MMNDREFSNRKETLHGEFYENALKYPERIALIYENEKVSYKMLRLYALRAANYMWQRGVRRNDKIVVILPRGIGQVAALLGILAIGAAYVPIAMKQPLGRRKKIIENVKPALVLQDEAFLEENPWTGCIENNSKDTAYIIYTSGSSGEPKGVEMSHVAAMNTIEEILHMWNIGAEDSVLNISAFDFDLSVFDIFGLLTVGGTIVLIDEDDFRDPEVWKNLIEIYGITIWNSAPALLDMFLIMGENNHFGKLRLALVSGDWIPLYLPEKWYKVTSANSQFVALGGATEGGIWSNYYCVSKVDKLWNSIPYGQALPKQKYRITDENFVECGVDIPGELQIGGGSLAKGYINDEELTMKKFITDVKGERWYRTGDRGRRWADGTIEFLGRMDTQVKIRGHRIELGEIESVLKSISRIKEAVVVAQGDKYHKELVAFYLGEYIAESEIEGMRFDEILRASLTMPTIMGIAQYISDCKNPSKNQMHSNAGNQTRNSYTVVYIFGDNENEIRDVLIEKLSASNISCKRVGGQEIIERCHEDINVKKKYIIAFSEMASLCITKASELLGENIIINRIFLINPSKAKESDLYLGDISIIDGNSVAIKSWEKAVLGNVREFESNSNDIFDIIMRELENDK